MKDLNVTEVFCEILSGMVALFMAAPILHLSGAITVDDSLEALTTRFSVAHVAGVIILAYLLGLIMDAVGLAIGEWFLDSMVDGTALTPEERVRFWSKVPEHVLKYRVLQWSYYSTYRNLFLLLLPGTVFWMIVATEKRGMCGGIITLAAGVLLELVFWKSMETLLGIYFKLGKYEYEQETSAAGSGACGPNLV